MLIANSRTKWITIAVVFLFLVVAVFFLFVEQRGSNHAEFGRIYQIHFDEAPKGLKKIARRFRLLFSDTSGVMRLGSTMLFWSLASNDSSPKTGYLYFGDRSQHKWEFAPCGHSRLPEVTRQDLDCQFYGKQHPDGKEAFGNSWRTNTLYVAEGQIFFARSVSAPSVVYVVHLAKQGGDSNSGSILIEYVKVPRQKLPDR